MKCIFHEASAGAQLQAPTPEHKSNSPAQQQQYVVRGLPQQQGSGRDRPQCFPTGEPSSRKGVKAASRVSHRMSGWRATGFVWAFQPQTPSKGMSSPCPPIGQPSSGPACLRAACAGYGGGGGVKYRSQGKGYHSAASVIPSLI